MTRYVFRPLPAWTDPATKDRKSGAIFKAKFDDTLKLLCFEAEQLGAELVVVQVVASEADLRQDGMLRARAQVKHAGAVVSMETRHGPLRYATDVYDNHYYSQPPAWHYNVRAIALALQALRAVDRYGVTRSGEQYRGWNALPSGIEVPPAPMTVDEAARFVAEHGAPSLISMGGWALLQERSHATELRRAYLAAARKLHPDTGGSEAGFKRLQDAMRILGGDR